MGPLEVELRPDASRLPPEEIERRLEIWANLPRRSARSAELRPDDSRLSPEEIERRLAALERLSALAVDGVEISEEALRRENMYEPDRGL